jgi:hypothetical protein
MMTICGSVDALTGANHLSYGTAMNYRAAITTTTTTTCSGRPEGTRVR